MKVFIFPTVLLCSRLSVRLFLIERDVETKEEEEEEVSCFVVFFLYLSRCSGVCTVYHSSRYDASPPCPPRLFLCALSTKGFQLSSKTKLLSFFFLFPLLLVVLNMSIRRKFLSETRGISFSLSFSLSLSIHPRRIFGFLLLLLLLLLRQLLLRSLTDLYGLRMHP